MDHQKRFYGMITNIDDNFKKLDDRLKDLGLDQNTIVIFLTDNGTAGGIATSGGVSFGFDGGMRGAKNSEYEGGHRVPLFIRWPEGKLTGGNDIPVLTAHIDILPTLVELCNLDFQPVNNLDGTSLVPLLRNSTNSFPDRTLIGAIWFRLLSRYK